jgi:hypothetical protein
MLRDNDWAADRANTLKLRLECRVDATDRQIIALTNQVVDKVSAEKCP